MCCQSEARLNGSLELVRRLPQRGHEGVVFNSSPQDYGGEITKDHDFICSHNFCNSSNETSHVSGEASGGDSEASR